MHLLITPLALLGQLGVLPEQLERLVIILVGVQVHPQLRDDKQQGLELGGVIVGEGSRLHLQMEGEVQAGEQGAIGQGVGLAVFLAALLLEGDIWYRQRGAGRHSAAGVPAGAGSSSVGIQANDLLEFSLALTATPYYAPSLGCAHKKSRKRKTRRHIEFGKGMCYNTSSCCNKRRL